MFSFLLSGILSFLFSFLIGFLISFLLSSSSSASSSFSSSASFSSSSFFPYLFSPPPLPAFRTRRYSTFFSALRAPSSSVAFLSLCHTQAFLEYRQWHHRSPTSARRAAVVSLRRADRRPWVLCFESGPSWYAKGIDIFDRCSRYEAHCAF